VVAVGSWTWNDDDELMRDLTDALRLDEVERRVVDSARVVSAWRAADADLELAALVHDSAVAGAAGVRAPGPHRPRTLAFGHAGMGVEIEVSDAGMEGQLIPPERGVARMLTGSGSHVEVTSDEVGCFSFPAQDGPVRIECATTRGTFTTGWILP
jgi:hypothetical protein